jgi:aspartate carbamoyltransferase regulatory subunit
MKRLAFIKSLLRNLPTILEKKFGVNKKINLSLPRRIGRVVDCGSLENCCTARYRGFESLILRYKMKVWFLTRPFLLG